MLAATNLLDMSVATIEAKLAAARAAYDDYIGPGGLVCDVDYAESLLAAVVMFERLLVRASRQGR